ncbi:MAG: DegT/DnrJ/EryC1/StrS family aminotransferase [Candidatus Omnitrophica bacterium]|jgi:dTDP-4-amino-4,6-dideoxygalactose transaminase|nr:DegT/DnrJ/EryC1/StrS family aminotransferase [Candidatus Omnitrophota bacterium]
MSIFKEIPPTSGWPFRIKDLFSKCTAGSLEEDFKNYLGVSDLYITYSGTAALYLIFESLKKISPKKTVIIPSYVCPLVALAAQKSGLRIKVCDINKDSFDFNYDCLKALCSTDSDILAIVVVHLGGIALDFDRINEIAEVHKIFTIEDCAHALGAKYKEKKCGTLSDFSFFSLCRGKGLTIYEGGVLVVNRKEHSEVVANTIKQIVRKNYFSEIIKIIELLGYWIFYRPQLFWFVFKLPQIFWNLGKNPVKAFGEEYDTNFDTHSVSGFRKLLGHKSFYRLENEISQQREKALFYIEALRAIKGVKVMQGDLKTYVTYPFLVVLFDEAKKRNELLKKVGNCGLGVSIVYLNAICDYSYLKDKLICEVCGNACDFSERQLTLSTSVFLKNKDAQFIINSIKQVLS